MDYLARLKVGFNLKDSHFLADQRKALLAAQHGVGRNSYVQKSRLVEGDSYCGAYPPEFLNTVVALGRPTESGTVQYTATGFLFRLSYFLESERWPTGCT